MGAFQHFYVGSNKRDVEKRTFCPLPPRLRILIALFLHSLLKPGMLGNEFVHFNVQLRVLRETCRVSSSVQFLLDYLDLRLQLSQFIFETRPIPSQRYPLPAQAEGLCIRNSTFRHKTAPSLPSQGRIQ